MDMTDRKFQELVALIGEDRARDLLLQATATQKAADDQRVAYKAAPVAPAAPATSPLDDALDTLTSTLADLETDTNEQALADHLNAFSARLAASMSGAAGTKPAKTTDTGPQATKNRRTSGPATFSDWLMPGGRS